METAAISTDTSGAVDPDPSLSPTPTEISDDDLRELTRAAREKAAANGGVVEFQPIEPERLGVSTHALPSGVATWEPPCTKCFEPIGYTAPDGKYVGTTECAKCRAGSVAARLAASGITPLEIDAPLRDLKTHGPDGKPYTDYTQWLAYLHSFAALQPGQRINPPFAFACGNNGVGKSAGAQRALRDAINNGCQGRYLRLSELLRGIYATYGTDESTEDRMRFYANVHLLVIDEVGQDEASDHAMGLFFEVADDRWSRSMPTIFLSNYLPQADSLGARITEKNDNATRMKGIIDRIIGGARSNIFVIRGKSWRSHA